MKLRQVHGIVDLGHWCQDHGLSPGEHPKFGGVHPVHTKGSLHYGRATDLAAMLREKRKGLALDVNDRDVDDDVFAEKWGPVKSEKDALTIVYFRVLTAAEVLDWPLEESFFGSHGFIVEEGFDHNHPISGHDDHWHVGFSRPTW